MVAQFRILGGVIALATITCVSTPLIRSALLEAISPEQTHEILERLEIIPHLPEETQAHVRSSFQHGFGLQMKIIMGFAAGNIPATLMMMSKQSLLEKLRLYRNSNVDASG
jgi:hypothetical protein